MRHVLPCAVLVYDKIARKSDDEFDDDVYRLQYTVTSKPFRRRFFNSLEVNPNRFTRGELYTKEPGKDVVEKLPFSLKEESAAGKASASRLQTVFPGEWRVREGSVAPTSPGQ